MLRFLLVYFKGMRLMMFQLSSFYCRVEAIQLEHQNLRAGPSTNHPKAMFQLSGVHCKVGT